MNKVFMVKGSPLNGIANSVKDEPPKNLTGLLEDLHAQITALEKSLQSFCSQLQPISKLGHNPLDPSIDHLAVPIPEAAVANIHAGVKAATNRISIIRIAMEEESSSIHL